MANSKLRCASCRGYFPQDSTEWKRPNGLTNICSSDCLSEWMSKQRASTKRKRSSTPLDLRKQVHERDQERCQICDISGKFVRMHVHHVIFRSQQGKDELDNLVLLCHECHMERAHGSEAETYREILQAKVRNNMQEWGSRLSIDN